ncbi:ribose 5-phosphate isomerase B [Anaerolineales bacterium]
MKIVLASDHAGFDLKAHMVNFVSALGYEVLDLGVESSLIRSDYPDVAQGLGQAILDGQADRGILICGSGVGASIAANKMKGIYAAICHDTYSAAQGVEHDNMNVLCLGGRIVGPALAEILVKAFLVAKFNTETERYGRRFEKVREMEA